MRAKKPSVAYRMLHYPTLAQLGYDQVLWAYTLSTGQLTGHYQPHLAPLQGHLAASQGCTGHALYSVNEASTSTAKTKACLQDKNTSGCHEASKYRGINHG